MTSHSEKPLVSVIVPVYNIEKYIGRCIESIRSQTYADLEIILVDDGSTDSSGTICDEYAGKDSRIKVIHQKNGGVSSARNRGLDAATGDYIGFVDGDDYIDRRMYANLISKFLRDDVDIAITGFAVESTPGNFIRHCTEEGEIVLSRSEQLTCLMKNRLYSCSCCDKLFRRELLENIRFDCKITNYEDYLFLYQVMKRSSRAVFSSELSYYYCSNSASATTSKFSHKKMTMMDVCEYICDDIAGFMPELMDIAQAELIRNALMCAAFAAKDHYAGRKDIKRLRDIVRSGLLRLCGSYLAAGYKIQGILLAISYPVFRWYVTGRNIVQ